MNFNEICPPLAKYVKEVNPQVIESSVLQFLEKRVFNSVSKLPSNDGSRYSGLYKIITEKEPFWAAQYKGDTYRSENGEFQYFFTSYIDATNPTLCFRGKNLGTKSDESSTEGFIFPSGDAREDREPITYKKFSLVRGDENNPTRELFKTVITCDGNKCQGTNDFGDTYSSTESLDGKLVQKLCLRESPTTDPVCNDYKGNDLSPLTYFLNRGHGKSLYQQTIIAGSAIVCVGSLFMMCRSINKIWNIHQTGNTQVVKREMLKVASFFASAVVSGTVGYFYYNN